MSGLEEWRINRPGPSEVDTDLFDIKPLREAFNRFANGATLPVLDSDGTKVDDYPYGERLEVQYSTDGGSTWTTRLAGIAMDRTRTTRRGVPMLEIEMVGYDHLLRRRKVYKTYSSQTISTILNDLITTFTSVNWVAGNVDIQNDRTLTREFRGERVDEAIQWLLSRSADEEYGVNNDLEFFARQQLAGSVSPLTEADIIDYDLPRNGKRAINRFQLFYDDGGNETFVTVQDLEAQNDLQDKLGTPRPVVISDSDTWPEIDNEDAAKGIAEQALGEREELLTGTITTYGRYTASAGDIINVNLPEAGITTTDFRIAQIEYYWQRGETVLTVAENAKNIDDLLVGLSDSVDNDRARDADPTASGTDFLQYQSGVTVSVSGTLETKSARADNFVLGQSQLGLGTGDELGGGFQTTSSVNVEDAKITAGLLNLIRDLWQDGNSAFTDLSHLGVGTDDTTPSAGDTDLYAEIDRTSVDVFGATSEADEFEVAATVPAGGTFAGNTIREFTVHDADTGGDIYMRAIIPDVTLGSDESMDISLVFTIENDGDEQGVITTKGQERIRDLVIGESNHEPSSMLYGTGTTAAAEGDTSLGTQVHSDTIDSTADRSPGVTDIVERVGTGEANGNDLTEWGYENSAGELLARLVAAQYAKSSSAAVETNYRFRAGNA